MNIVTSLGTYQPTWVDQRGRRTLGPDEDVATLAVEAGLAALNAAPEAEVSRVVLCTRSPDYLLGNQPSVVLAGLGLPESTPFEERLAGAPAVLDAIASGAPGTLVIGVDPAPPAGSGAVLLAGGDASQFELRTHQVSLPISVVEVSADRGREYDDVRLLRERGWLRNRSALGLESGIPAVLCGVPPKDAARLGADQALQQAVTSTGAAGAISALSAASSAGAEAYVVAFENGLTTSLRLRGPSIRVQRSLRAPITKPDSYSGEVEDGGLILSLPAYERAFDSKVRFEGYRCQCGELHFPHRTLCHNCGSVDEYTTEALPRTGHVYSIVTIHMTVPGKRVPYSLALVELDGVELRVLAPVTDALAGIAGIDTPGRLVLRLAAIREGVRDYGYAFQPEEQGA